MQRLRKKRVVIKRRTQARQLLREPGLIPQRALGKFLQARQPGAAIALGKDDIKAHGGYLLALKQFTRQGRHLVAAPGPLAHLLQAFFVDVDDDDAFVLRARHCGAQPGVIDDVVQLLQHLQMQNAGGMQEREQQRKQRDRNALPAAAKKMQ